MTIAEHWRAEYEKARGEIVAVLDAASAQKRDINPQENKRLKTLHYELEHAKTELDKALRTERFAAEAAEIRGPRKSEPSQGKTAAMTDVHPDAPLASRLFAVTSEYEVRSLLTSTSSSAISTVQAWSEFSAYLSNQSQALASGARVIDIDATQVKIPAGTALATGAWLAEGGTATASDMGVTSYTVTPSRLTVFSEVSNEVLEDASFPALETISEHLFSSLGELLDAAIFEGQGASNEPQGMLNLAGSSTASSGGTAVDLGYFVTTQENSLAANAPVEAWATNAAAWGVYAGLTIGGTADLRPLLQTDAATGGAAIAGRVLGRPLYVTNNIDAAGAGTATVYGYTPDDVWVVRRRDFRMIADPFSKAEQGLTRFVLEGRFGVVFPQPSTVNVFTVLTP